MYVNYTADFLWLGHCKGKLATSLRLRGAALKAFVEVGTSAAVRAVLQRASRADTSGLREELDSQPFELVRTQLKKDAEVRDEQWQLVLKERDEHWQLVSKERDEHWQLVSKEREEHWRQLVEAWDKARDDRILSHMARQCEQLSLGVVFAMQRGVTAALQPLLLSLQPLGELLGSLKGLTSSVSMSVRGAVKDVIDAAVTSTDSKLVKAFRAATKAPAKRSSADAAKFPASQRATPKQKVEALTLAKVACAEFPRRDLHYNSWKVVRSEYGKRAKAERLRRHSLPASSADFEAQPLLWCSGLLDGCKERYLYLEQHRAMLREVWHHKPPFGKSLHDWSVEVQATAVSEVGYVELDWPEDAAEHEVFG
jgi:hypothetical protein